MKAFLIWIISLTRMFLANEIIENVQAGLADFREIVETIWSSAEGLFSSH